ncbi:MAG: hypothetical protein M1828_002221 [Chrysothrix sp. TS-e1954]|nr:MAG: hypothetical protein M1828_002221 [Chrysothrix sp. TS-e1954]
MEAAPLTTAHSLAHRDDSNGPTSVRDGVSRHQDAAAKYKEASEGIEDTEALRILELLESHHRQVAGIISSRSSDRASPSTANSPTEKQAAQKEQQPAGDHALAPRSGRQPKQPSSVAQRRPPRDLSASIASNLASARGIPRDRRGPQQRDHPALPKHHTWDSQSSRPLSPGVSKREDKESSTTSKGSDPSSVDTGAFGAGRAAEAVPSSDDAFHKFYNRFEGLLSKLSAPLAFAGLPLRDEDEAPGSPATTQLSKASGSVHASTNPAEINSMFSKAALRAVKEDNGPFPGVQESFYVVPTGGGTVSYANMISRQAAQSGTDNEPTSVDAREKPAAGAPNSEEGTRLARSRKGKTVEELELENDTLKKLADDLARRLYEFEKNAQYTTSALHKSMALRQKPPTSPTTEMVPASEVGDARMKELEEQVQTSRREIERYERENEKLKTVVLKYRERWEIMKAGSKGRKEQGSEKDAGG